MDREYANPGPSIEDVAASRGALLLEFGTGWCGICLAALPLIEGTVAEFPGLIHQRVEDGPGRKLGRSFRVKLWPTLIMLRDGIEVTRVVRPQNAEELREAISRIID